MIKWSPLYFMLLLVLLAGCGDKPDTGPGEVKWDRDACERCRMVLSDRNHSAQIRIFPPEKKRSKLINFDDIGCAVIWLENQPWKDDPKTEIWVADRKGAGWLDARKATYVKGDMTPMEYGLGAQEAKVEGGLDYAQAKVHILDVEKRFNLHGVDLLKRLEERQQKPESEHSHKHTAGETQ
jgi:copper chaperone NosL